MKVWKFPVNAGDVVGVSMPAGAEVLTVQVQGNQPMMWASVDPSAPIVQRVFRWVGTGQHVESVGRYIGTVQLMDGALVLHLFEVAHL